MAVFDEFHNVSSTVIELTDGARVPVLDAMSRTLFLTLDRRDKAIADVHTLAPPVPPRGCRGRRRERACERGAGRGRGDVRHHDAGADLFLDDEIQHIDGLASDATDLRPGGSRILTKGRAQIVQTEATINTLWPPVDRRLGHSPSWRWSGWRGAPMTRPRRPAGRARIDGCARSGGRSRRDGCSRGIAATGGARAPRRAAVLGARGGRARGTRAATPSGSRSSSQTRLEQLPAQQIADFGAIRRRLDERAYTWELWGAAYVIDDGCSDDCFRDFRAYLISLGREPYEAALKSPDSLAPVVQDAETGDWENADDVAPEAYEDVGRRVDPVRRQRPLRPAARRGVGRRAAGRAGGALPGAGRSLPLSRWP